MLTKDSAKIVMKALYGCRFVRFDLLWPVGDCARHTAKWSKAYDRRLEKLVGHIKGTLDHALEGFLGNRADECHIVCYCDASFADELKSSKSTSGMFIAIVGPDTFMPINAFAKKQGAVSHSSIESETISLEESLRTGALPILTFWEHVVQLFGKPKKTKAGADGKATPMVSKLQSQSSTMATDTAESTTATGTITTTTTTKAEKLATLLESKDASSEIARNLRQSSQQTATSRTRVVADGGTRSVPTNGGLRLPLSKSPMLTRRTGSKQTRLGSRGVWQMLETSTPTFPSWIKTTSPSSRIIFRIACTIISSSWKITMVSMLSPGCSMHTNTYRLPISA